MLGVHGRARGGSDGAGECLPRWCPSVWVEPMVGGLGDVSKQLDWESSSGLMLNRSLELVRVQGVGAGQDAQEDGAKGQEGGCLEGLDTESSVVAQEDYQDVLSCCQSS